MKFGEKYRMLMAPEWEEFYVPYNSLKIRFNELLVNGYHSGTKARLAGMSTICVGCTSNHLGLYADIEHWNQVYTGFSDKMRVFLKRQFMAGAFYSVSENVHFIRASVEVRDEYEKLLLFDLMNEKALSKLSKKLERCNHFADADQHTPIQVPKNHLKTTDVIMHISSYVDKILGSILRGQPDTKYLNIITANFPRRFARAICRAAEADDVALLNHVLHWKDAQESDDARYINLLSTVLVLSVAWHARGSTEYIVRQLLDFPDIEFGRLLCQIVTITGRMDLEIHAALDRGDPARIQESTGVGFFASVLSQLGRSKKESSLMQTDLTGRIPLHYAAMYGLTEICQSIMETCYQLAPRYCAACLEITDDTGYTPMYYAVASNRPEIVKMFIKILGNNYDKHDAARFQNLENTVEKLLCMAMRDGYDAVVQILAESGIGAKAFPDNRTTGLHVAAEVGRADYIKLLIANGRASEVFFQEPLRGWTPLITACAGGHLAAVNALLEMASWPDPHDSLGWTAKEHAVSRGHLAVAELIPDCSCDRLTGGPAAGLTKPPIRPNFRRALDSSLIHLVLHPGNVQGGDESCFGVANENDPRGTWVVELSASDVGEPINSGSQQSHRIDVPSLDDHTFSPVVFSGFSQTKICLRCRVLELDVNGMATTVVGNGVAMLGNASTRLAEGCEGISRTITVPIFGLDLSSVIAKVTFSYVMSKPFVLSDLPLGKRADGAERAAIVGHRGM